MPGHAWRPWLALVACVLLPAAAVVPAPDARLAAMLPQPTEVCLRAEIAASATRVRSAMAFAVALRDPSVTRIVITQNLTLDAVAFPRHDPIRVNRTVLVTGPCDATPVSVTLSLGDSVVARVVVGSGGELQFAGPALRIANAVAATRHPIWPDHNPLLLALVELNGTGAARLSDLTVVSNSPVNASMMMQRYPAGMRPDYLLNRRGSSLFLRGWTLMHEQYADAAARRGPGRKRVRRLLETAAAVAGGSGGEAERGVAAAGAAAGAGTAAGAAAAAEEAEDGGGSSLPVRARRLLARHSRRRALLAASSVAAAGDSEAPPWPAAFVNSLPPTPAPTASWAFKNVRLEMPNTVDCFTDAVPDPGSSIGFSARGMATCDNGDRLKVLLRDQSITRIALMGDIIFHETTDGAENSVASAINITRKVEIRGCRPDPLNPNLVDFGELVNYIKVSTGGAMIWSGNAHMINARSTPVKGAGPGDLIPALAARGTGTIDLNGVAIRSKIRSVFSDFSNPFWGNYPGASFTPAPTDFVRLAPPPLRERSLLLVQYTFKRTPWLKATGQDAPGQGGGVISYRNVQVMWESAGDHALLDSAFALGPPGGLDRKTMAIALGAGLGGGGLLAAATLAWAVSQSRKRRAAEAETEAVKKAVSMTKSVGGRTATDGGASLGGGGSDSARGRDGGGGAGALVGARWGPTGSSGGTTGLTPLVERGTEARIEEARQLLARRTSSSGPAVSAGDQIVLQELLGEGAFGKVYKGLWKGTVVAVKTMLLPTNAAEKRERMAIMETAISSSLSHPNIVHTYTYAVAPVHRGMSTSGPTSSLQADGESLPMEGSFAPGSMSLPGFAAAARSSNDGNIHSWEVRLVLEYCDKGTMREMLAEGCFRRPGGRVDLAGVVATALDVARAMVFLHENQIVHADLKARNVLLKSTGTDPRGWTAKVGDFGLSIRIDPGATHISDLFQGTITHMAPETLDLGRISRASDVYAFGVLLFELYTGESAFKGVPKAMLGYEIAKLNRRPRFTAACPHEYARLAERCWASDVASRPSFEAIVQELQRMQRRLSPDGETLLPASTAAHSGSGNAYHPAIGNAPSSAPLPAAARPAQRSSGGESSPRHGVRTEPRVNPPVSGQATHGDEEPGTKDWDSQAAAPAGGALPPAASRHGGGVASPDRMLRLGNSKESGAAAAAADAARGGSAPSQPASRPGDQKPRSGGSPQLQQGRPWDDSVQTASDGITLEPSTSTLAWRGPPIIPWRSGALVPLGQALPAGSDNTLPIVPTHPQSSSTAAAVAGGQSSRSAFAAASSDGAASADESPSRASQASSHMAAAAAAVAAAVASVHGLPQTPLAPPLRFGSGGAGSGTSAAVAAGGPPGISSILAEVTGTTPPTGMAATPRALAAWRLQRIASSAAEGSGAPIAPRAPSANSPGGGGGDGSGDGILRTTSAASLRAFWESRAASATGSNTSGRGGLPGSVSPESHNVSARLPPTPGLMRTRSAGTTTPQSGPLPPNMSPPRDGLRLPPAAAVPLRARSAAPGPESPRVVQTK